MPKKAKPAPEFLNRPAVCRRYSLSLPTLVRWIEDGRFPAPSLKVGSRRLWALSDLLRWEAEARELIRADYERNIKPLVEKDAGGFATVKLDELAWLDLGAL